MQALVRPSIQIGLLAEVGRRAGHEVSTLHAALDFAKLVLDRFEPRTGADLIRASLAGTDVYASLAEMRGAVGDWLFSIEAFGADAPDPDHRYLDERTADDGEAFDRDLLIAIRNEVVPMYLDQLCTSVPGDELDIVGFSSTFQQNVASIALARRLKHRFPHLTMLFGGANFDDTMGPEWVRSVDAIDLALQGECDETFPALLTAISERTNVLDVPGVLVPSECGVLRGPEPRPLEDMNSSPTPDYSEYFERAHALGLIPSDWAHRVDVPFETSRGCWWGQRAHCTFCGLNGTTMAYRAKSPERLLCELDTLSQRHGTLRLSAVDNIIDTEYLTTALPELAEAEHSFDLFYETKADLSRADIELMARAGIKRLQPGIESLSSRVLGLMRKGTRAAWNVNLLRWAEYYGIAVAWNLLWGFPGESAADYEEQTNAMAHLHHLQAPAGVGRVWLERFSPLFTDIDRYGIVDRSPSQEYRYLYPPTVKLGEAAYYFDYASADTLDPSDIEPMVEAAIVWDRRRSESPRPALTLLRAPSFSRIVDHRDPKRPRVHELEGLGAQIYEFCMNEPRTAAAVAEQIAGAPVEAVRKVLDGFTDRGLMFRDRALYLSLALPPAPFSPSSMG